MGLQKIVVATDFSNEAGHALGHALDIGRHTGAEIVLVHVCPVIEPAQYIRGQEWLELMREHMTANRHKLEELRTSVSGQGVTVSHMVVDDVPDEGIIRSAEELGADLIVVGTHGYTGIRRVLLGSVAERVTRGSHTSVLVAREQGRPTGGYRRILVPTDFSPSADRALALACELVAQGGTIDVRHYWHEPVFGPVLDIGTLAGDMERATTELASERLARHESSRYHLEFSASGGLAKQSILDQLDQEPYDIVVMGSHGRRGIRRLVIGSVAESTVRHAPCSVLVARHMESTAAEP